MFTRAAAVTLALVMLATLGAGPVAPKPAEANDTGKILAGLAAGALVYGILDGADRDRRDYDRRGYYDGNRRSYKYDDRRQYQRHQDYRYGPNRGAEAYNRGWNNGYDRGFDRGHDVGYNRGYDRGYDHGWGDGYDYGRRTGGGCWGGWGY